MTKKTLKEMLELLKKELNAQRERNKEILQMLYQLQNRKIKTYKVVIYK